MAGVKEETYLDGVMGEANPILLGMSIFLIAFLVALGLVWLRMTTASKGGNDDHLYEMVDADEYEDYDYDNDGYDED